MSEARAAGARSGIGAVLLDGSKPLSGLLADTLRREVPQPRTPAPFAGSIASDPGPHREVLGRSRSEPTMSGSIPRPGVMKQYVALPGYKGHVQGKVSENMHGGTFGSENRRATQTLPLQRTHGAWVGFNTLEAPPVADARRHSRAPKVAQTVPGYMGTIPGKDSETIHGVRMAEASRRSQLIRDEPPVTEIHSWLKRGVWPVDRMATYKWSNRFSKINLDAIFTTQEDEHAFEATRELGRTFGMKAEHPHLHKPSDRYLHALIKPKTRTAKVDPNAPAAGQASISNFLDQERWRLHYGQISGGTGNQRAS